MIEFQNSIYYKINNGVFDDTVLATCNITNRLSATFESYVYLFQDENSNKKYTVKHIINYKNYFTDETIKLIESINHPKIAKVIDCIEDGNDLFIVKEYIEGEVLNNKFLQKQIVLESDLYHIMLGIIEILEYLHNKNKIIHRDIKPSNLIVNPDGEIILIDLLSVRSYKEESKEDTLYVGTSGYAAPEQFGYSQTDVRTDIYNFGATIKSLMGSRVNQCISLDKIVNKCLEFNPDSRYQSIDNLKIDVMNISNENISSEMKKYKYLLFFLLVVGLLLTFLLVNSNSKLNDLSLQNTEIYDDYNRPIYYKGIEIKASDWVHIIGGQYDPIFDETQKIFGSNRRVNASGVGNMDSMQWIEMTVDVFIYSSYNAYNDLPLAFRNLVDFDRYNNLEEGESIKVNYYSDSEKEIKVLIVNPSLN